MQLPLTFPEEQAMVCGFSLSCRPFSKQNAPTNSLMVFRCKGLQTTKLFLAYKGKKRPVTTDEPEQADRPDIIQELSGVFLETALHAKPRDAGAKEDRPFQRDNRKYWFSDEDAVDDITVFISARRNFFGGKQGPPREGL